MHDYHVCSVILESSPRGRNDVRVQCIARQIQTRSILRLAIIEIVDTGRGIAGFGAVLIPPAPKPHRDWVQALSEAGAVECLHRLRVIWPEVPVRLSIVDEAVGAGVDC